MDRALANALKEMARAELRLREAGLDQAAEQLEAARNRLVVAECEERAAKGRFTEAPTHQPRINQMNLDQEEIKELVVSKAVQEITEDCEIAEQVNDRVNAEVNRRIEAIFEKEATKKLEAAIEEAIRDGFTRPFQAVNTFGEPVGEKTTIKQELVKQVDGYWNCRVRKSDGAKTDGIHNSVSRAEYIMTKICAEDFTAMMEQNARNITGALKDGLRNQIAVHMDHMLSNLFKVKSLQDQGKVEKPY